MRTFRLIEEAIDLAVMVFVYFRFFYRRWNASRPRLYRNTVFYIYFCAVLMLTVLPIPLEYGLGLHLRSAAQSANLAPFHDLIVGHGGAMRDIRLNILMLIPFGFLLPVVKKARGIFTVLLSFLFSLGIELCQLLTTVLFTNVRSFDVTDIITNTAGGLLGYLLFLLFRPLVRRIFPEAS